MGGTRVRLAPFSTEGGSGDTSAILVSVNVLRLENITSAADGLENSGRSHSDMNPSLLRLAALLPHIT